MQGQSSGQAWQGSWGSTAADEHSGQDSAAGADRVAIFVKGCEQHAAALPCDCCCQRGFVHPAGRQAGRARHRREAQGQALYVLAAYLGMQGVDAHLHGRKVIIEKEQLMGLGTFTTPHGCMGPAG